MKRAMPAVVLVLGLAATGSAIEVGLGFQAGLRTMADAKIREVYGGGMSFFPSLRLVIWRGLEVGAGYEGGYAREGAIGLFEEKTTLSVAGFEGFVGYGHRLNILEPYVRELVHAVRGGPYEIRCDSCGRAKSLPHDPSPYFSRGQVCSAQGQAL
jgi:hypothetical protein